VGRASRERSAIEGEGREVVRGRTASDIFPSHDADIVGDPGEKTVLSVESIAGGCNLLKEELPVDDGRSEFNSTFRGLWSFCSCLRPLLRSGATCRVPVALTATTMAVPVTTGVDPRKDTTRPVGVTELNCPAPSLPVSQGRSTVSAVVFQVALVGAGEVTVLARLAKRARTRMRQERPLVSSVAQARTI
jgi:hypothetical protein